MEENQKFYEMLIKYNKGFDMSDKTADKDITRDDLLAEQKIWNQKKSDLKIKEQAYFVAKKKSDVELSEYNKELDTLRTKINLAKQTPAYQMEALVKQYAEFTAMGNSEKAEEIKKKLISAQEKLYSILNGMTQAISDRYDYMNSVLENIPMTDLQREEANKEMKAYKNAELNKAYKQQYAVMNNDYMSRQVQIAGLREELSKKQAERDRLPQGSEEASNVTKRIDELNADIALQMERQTASMSAMQEIANKERISGMLSHVKTLLEETEETAKQALSDGLVNYLTEGVNEAKSLGEALQNMVVDFLKTIQKLFAKRLVEGVMQQWFPVKDEFGSRPTTENLAPKVTPGQIYTLNQYKNVDKNGLTDYFSPIRSQLHIMASEDGTGIQGLQTYRDYSDLLGLKNPETGHYFEMDNSKKNYDLKNTWMQDGTGGYFRVLDQNKTYSELMKSQSALSAPTVANASAQAQQATNNASIETTVSQTNTSLQQLSDVIQQSSSGVKTSLEELSGSATSAKRALDTIATSAVSIPSGQGSNAQGHKDGGLIRKFSTGGNVKGEGTSTSDSIPAMLSNGEFVVKASAVRKYGIGFLNAVNNGNFTKIHSRVYKFADGGSVVSSVPQETARGMQGLAKNVGASINNTTTMNVALVNNQQEAMKQFMQSPQGQRIMLDFSRGVASFTSNATNGF